MADLEHILHEGALAVLDGVGDAISIQGPDMRVVYQNQVHIDMMGDHAGEECFRAFRGRDGVCPECRLVSALYEGKTGRWEAEAARKDGGVRYVEIVARPLRDATGSIVAAMETVRDVTERRLMTEKINAITSDLEQRTWKLMAANKELESFSYTLSHDINNYIARISMASHLLKDEFAAVLADRGDFLLTSIEESCRELEMLVDSTLLLCRSGRGDIARELVDLTALVTEIAEDFSLQSPERSVKIDIAPGLRAIGDRQLLKIALKNLFGNAWKYTANTAAPHIRFCAEERDEKTVFVISDNGCGFAMEEAGRLFKPFCRLQNAQAVKGTGIGLATVKRVVEVHNGTVWGQGELGKGASFCFTLGLTA